VVHSFFFPGGESMSAQISVLDNQITS
jgi:hypothetical protein